MFAIACANSSWIQRLVMNTAASKVGASMVQMLLSTRFSAPSMLVWRSGTSKWPLAGLTIWRSVARSQMLIQRIAFQGTLSKYSCVRTTCFDTWSVASMDAVC